MIPLLILVLLIIILGGLGFASHVLWFILIAAVVIWLIGFLVSGVDGAAGKRRWYGRW